MTIAHDVPVEDHVRRRFGRRAALGLTAMRALLGPATIVLAQVRADGRLIAVALLAAIVSDVYDGRIARRFGVDGAELRRLDSVADSIFYVCAAIALWIAHPEIVAAHALLLGGFFGMQLAGYLVDLVKFGRDTSYHAWSARLTGALLFVAATVIFCVGRAGPWLSIALVAGMLSHLDAFAITMILPEWRHDVHTIRAALEIRDAVTRGRREHLPR
jgi:phosphatidylglycerophosphate synthase